MSETNTLIVYKLPKALVEDAANKLAAVKLPGIVRFIQVRFLQRVLAVFSSAEAAAASHDALKRAISEIPGCAEARVGFSMTPINPESQPHLQLPDPGTLLFVSPPPSPPNEWQEQMEEEPNQRTHYEAHFTENLHRALKACQETPSPNASPVSFLGSPRENLKQEPVSPRTVTIIEARASNPALNLITSDN